MFDLIIRGGLVVDGTGVKPFSSDIGVTGETITVIGDLASARAKRVVPAEGLIAAPGFIDMHAHQDLFLLADRTAGRDIQQGVTACVNGNCGLGIIPFPLSDPAPLLESLLGLLGDFNVGPDWTGAEGYFDRLSGGGIGVNALTLIGHNALRIAAMGRRKDARSEDIGLMKDLLGECFEAGASGLSTGLIYQPACFASREELVALASVAARHDRIFSVHLRDENEHIVDSVREAVGIAKDAGCRLQISHLKVYGPENEGLIDEIFGIAEEETRAGMEIHFDSYPYTFGSTSLATILPPEFKGMDPVRLIGALSDAGARRGIRDLVAASRDPGAIVLNWIASPEFSRLRGETLEEAAGILGKDWVDLACELLVADRLRTSIFIRGVTETTVKKVMAHRFQMVGSDGLFGDSPHPRAYGTFPRVLRKYVYDEKALSLESAVEKMSGLAASKLRLRNRGTIREGNFADLVVFDGSAVGDRATVSEPARQSAGIRHVLVNGVFALDGGVLTGSLSGRVIR